MVESNLSSDDTDVLLRGGRHDLDLDTVFELLSHQRRRIVLGYLRRHPDERLSVEELASAIADWERDLTSARTDPSTDIQISLAHRHLPALDDAGVIDHHPDDDTVTYEPSPRLERFMEMSNREGPLP